MSRALAAPDGPGLSVRDVSFAIGGLRILTGVDLECPPAQVTGLIGPNGAGKTTLLNCISGLYRATAGTIRLGEAEIQDRRCYQVARAGVGRTFQTPQVVENLSVVDNVMLGGHGRMRQHPLRDSLSLIWPGADEASLRAAAREQLERVGLSAIAERSAGGCTHIERRLVEVARALCGAPQVLLLDEPCAGMSGDGRAVLREIILGLAGEGVTILLVEHDVLFVSTTSHHLAVLDQGRVIASGEPSEVINSQPVIDAYLGRRGMGAKGDSNATPD